MIVGTTVALDACPGTVAMTGVANFLIEYRGVRDTVDVQDRCEDIKAGAYDFRMAVRARQARVGDMKIVFPE